MDAALLLTLSKSKVTNLQYTVHNSKRSLLGIKGMFIFHLLTVLLRSGGYFNFAIVICPQSRFGLAL